jgi:hypothetical protein
MGVKSMKNNSDLDARPMLSRKGDYKQLVRKKLEATAHTHPKASSHVLRKTMMGVIKAVPIVFYEGRSLFAIELERRDGSTRLIYLFPPVIESQFIFQLSKRVVLQVEKKGGCWRLRPDRRALRKMKAAGVYDASRLPITFGPKRWQRPLTGWLDPRFSLHERCMPMAEG